jgi:TolA-binding protein
MGISMNGRTALVLSMVLALGTLTAGRANAQDVPGIEICTVEKTMERRTSCLQSNVDFLQKTIAKLGADHQQKLDAANRQIEALKSAVASLQKIADDLRAAQKKVPEDQNKKADAPPPKDAPAVKDAPAAKDGAK